MTSLHLRRSFPTLTAIGNWSATATAITLFTLWIFSFLASFMYVWSRDRAEPLRVGNITLTISNGHMCLDIKDFALTDPSELEALRLQRAADTRVTRLALEGPRAFFWIGTSKNPVIRYFGFFGQEQSSRPFKSGSITTTSTTLPLWVPALPSAAFLIWQMRKITRNRRARNAPGFDVIT